MAGPVGEALFVSNILVTFCEEDPGVLERLRLLEALVDQPAATVQPASVS